MKSPFIHLFVFAVGLGAAYLVRRGIRNDPGRIAEPFPLLLGMWATLACLTGWGLLRPGAGFALGSSLGVIWFLWLLRQSADRFLAWIYWLTLLASCVWVAQNGVLVESIKVPFAPKFASLGRAAFPVTVAWLWAVTYVIASPGQTEETAAGLCSIISAVFLAISVMQASFMGPLPAGLSAGVLGCCLGVVLGSRPRLTARVGPAGRSMLGLSLAMISVVGALKNTAFLVLIIPFLVLALPLLEVTYVFFSGRASPAGLEEQGSLSSGRSVALGRRSLSLHAYLLTCGMKREQVALLFYFGTAYLGAIAILLVALIEVHFGLKLLLLAVFVPAGFLVFYGAFRVFSAPGEGKGTVELFGIPIANLTSRQTLERIAGFIASERPHHVVTSDSLMLVRAQQDEEFRRILEGADLVTPDGTGVVWAGRLLGQPLRERVSGVDLVERICQLAAERGFSVYLLGGRPGVAGEAAQALQQRHAGLKLLGTQHGYFSTEEETKVIAEIAGLRPDVLFVGLGAPRQEKWITRNLHHLGVPVCIGVGGSLDVISGRLSRAPEWMQGWGLEWLYRAIKEPKRLPRLLGLSRFLLMMARSLGSRALEGRSKR